MISMLSDCLTSLLTFRLKAPKYHSPLLADQSFIQNYNWPRYINLIAKDFIEKLLVSECEGRLGHGESGSQDVKNHK